MTYNSQQSAQTPLKIETDVYDRATRTQSLYLSFDALMTIGKSLEQVISGPITGARSEFACKMVIR